MASQFTHKIFSASKALIGDFFSSQQELPDLYEATIDELQHGLEKGHFSSVDLVKAYIQRIEEVNTQGPALRAVLEINPKALEQAAALDSERTSKGPRTHLHGIPLLLKDNIATLHEEGMSTTAGSHALIGCVVPQDATVAAKLRTAGAILLGKASLSEWSNFRGEVPSGFCGRGGQGTNPYYPQADPSGSSSGSAISTAIGLAAGSLGTETDGSIAFPSGRCNLVGVKPTVGLTSRAGVVPISSVQDTVGPICRNVSDAAIILSVIAGSDPLDERTSGQPSEIPDYRKALKSDGLRSVRIGVPRLFMKDVDDNKKKSFDEALETMRGLGATIVDPAEFPNAVELQAEITAREFSSLETDLKYDLKAYLERLVEVPSGTRSLADVIEFNQAHADLELISPYYNDQSRFIRADKTIRDEEYYTKLALNQKMAREDGIDASLKKFNLDCMVLPTGGFSSRPSAVAGYPLITVPLGFQPDDIEPSPAKPTRMTAPGLPFGICFIGTAYSEYNLITYAYAFEQKTQIRLKRLAYPEAIPKTQLKDVIGKHLK